MSECTLCQIALPKNPHTLDGASFCCAGCLTVFQILKNQNVSEPYSSHPLLKRALEVGLISNPEVAEQIKSPTREIKKISFAIEDLFCPSCAIAITLLLEKQKGVSKVIVDYAMDLCIVEYSPRALSKEEIWEKIKALGYHPVSLVDEGEKTKERSFWIRFIVAAACAFNLMMLSIPLYIDTLGSKTEGYATLLSQVSLLLALPLYFYCGWPIWRKSFIHLRAKLMGMEFLVLIGATSSFVFSTAMALKGSIDHLYFDSMGMLILLVLLGRLLEKRAKLSAKETVRLVIRSLPSKARLVQSDGTTKFVPIKQLQPGDLIQVVTGEKIPLDGEIQKGEGGVDEALLTGESLPIWKKIGDPLIGGSLLKRGGVTLRVTKGIEETLVAKIVLLIEHQIEEKHYTTPLVDRIAHLFVPFVLALSFITFLLTDFTRSLSVLLISCPCAIGLATPLAYSAVISLFAKWGVVIRNRRVLTKLGKETVFVFDKTGTITEGAYLLRWGFENLSEEETGMIKQLAFHSRHPICLALSEQIDATPTKMDQIEEIVGKGMRGFFEGKEILLGSALMHKLDTQISQKEIGTMVYFSIDGEIRARLFLSDALRHSAKEAIGKLKSTLLLSGDCQEMVEKIASHIGFSDWQGEVDPLEKGQMIESLKKRGERVMMVGDGVNDGVALAAADVGVALSSGADLSIQVSDILLTNGNLALIDQIRRVARKADWVMKQNLGWAFGYNGVGLILAAGGLLSPLFAVLAMFGSSLAIVLNTSRLMRGEREPI